MATFAEAFNYLVRDLNWTLESDDIVSGVIELPSGRTQIVLAVKHDFEGTAMDFLVLYSPFAKVGEANLNAVVNVIRNTPVGISENPSESHHCAKIALAIDELDSNEIFSGVMAVAIAADNLEKAIRDGSDDL